MLIKTKAFYPILFIYCICLLQLPFVFGMPVLNNMSRASAAAVCDGDSIDYPGTGYAAAQFVYDSIDLEAAGLERSVFIYAFTVWNKLFRQGKLQNDSVIAIVDFSKPASKKRLYVLDIKNFKLLFHTLVAHGRNSGKEWTTSFSNKPASNKSSPGFYITGQTYYGSNGYSLKLQGIEKGINDKALQRAIVLHGADYVDASFVMTQGYIGRSQGCPAVPIKEAGKIINVLKDGACLYIHTGNQFYSLRSSLFRDFLAG